MIKLVEYKKVVDSKEYVKSHQRSAATNAHLCKTAGIEGSNRVVTVDYWFKICGVMNYLEKNWYYVTWV